MSEIPDNHMDDLRRTFKLLRKHNLKLNPEKCTFGVASGKFLGYMVSARGIEANPQKIQAIIALKSPKIVKEVQSLTGRVAALNRFISRATDKCHPFFKVIQKAKKDVDWTAECEEAFQQLKQYLMEPPLLANNSQEKHYTYIWPFRTEQ